MHTASRLVSICLLLQVCVLAATTSHAQTPIPAAPSVNASSYLVIDHYSKHIIAEKDADTRLSPASITKLMTAYVTFKKLQENAITLSDEVRISKRAYDAVGSRMFVEINSKVELEKLVMGMIVQSGNDASIAIAEHIGGTEEAFATLMNYHANALGMSNSQFLNSTGLPAEDHYSTARDIATLASAIIDEFPEYYRWYSVKEYTYNDITQHNRNSLLWSDASVDGMKTGHTDEAGYCLVASALRDDMRLVSVVLGTPSKRARSDVSQSLINYAFNFYKTYELYQANQTVATPRIWKADVELLKVGLDQNLSVTIPKGRYDSLKATMDLQQPITAPIVAGTQLGSVSVKLGDEVIAQLPLVALESIEEGGFFGRIRDSVLLWFE